MRPWKLSETNYALVQSMKFEVAVIPFGATEPHNFHLPYGTDSYEAEYIGDAICSEAHRRGAKVLLLPTVPYGTETNQMAFPLAMNLNPSTVAAVIGDLVQSLAHHGIRKIVLLNSHGGNEFKAVLRELYGKTPAKLFLCNWFQALRDVALEVFDEPDDHAGEMETSLIMCCRPDLVARRADGSLTADEGRVSPSRFEAVNRGWIQTTRAWELLTTNSGAGNPHSASVEKGERFMATLVERLATFLVELSASPLDERFPFV